MNTDELTREMTDLAKQEVARDFATWLNTSGSDELAQWSTRTGKCYVTETALARFVARSAHRLGDLVARGALIEYAAGLSDYIERDTFHTECVAALKKGDRS